MKKVGLFLLIAVLGAFVTATVDYATGLQDALSGMSDVTMIIHKLAYTMNGALLYWSINK
jgi:hypothetical protein